MRKIKLNILTPIPFWHPGTQELIDRLKQNDFEVVALDIWDFKFYNEKEEIVDLTPSILKGFTVKVYRKLNRKKIISKYVKKDQIVDIQWCGHYYSNFVYEIKKNSKKVFATLFGSDFYRSTNEQRAIQRKIFEVADKVVMGVNMQRDFSEIFPGLEHKYLFAQYGSKRLDIIGEHGGSFKKSELRKKYGLSKDKIVVTVGYNAKPEQQHFKIVETLSRLEVSILNQMFFIFPLTYGTDKKEPYYQNLISFLEKWNVEKLVIEDKMSDESLIETKLVSDITLNFQTTDALSSSIKESLASGDVLIVGDWLPYDVYKKLEVFYFQANFDSLNDILENTLLEIEKYKQKCERNSEAILKFASWNNLINQFITNYKS